VVGVAVVVVVVVGVAVVVVVVVGIVVTNAEASRVFTVGLLL